MVDLLFNGAGSFKVAKYHGPSKDAVVTAVKRGEYEVTACLTGATAQSRNWFFSAEQGD